MKYVVTKVILKIVETTMIESSILKRFILMGSNLESNPVGFTSGRCIVRFYVTCYYEVA